MITYNHAPGWDQPSAGETRPGLVLLKEYLLKRYGGICIGQYNDRPQRGSDRPSLHRDGRAIDWRQDVEKIRKAAADFLVANADALQIQRIHDYKNGRLWYCGDTENGQKARGWHAASKDENGNYTSPGFGEQWAAYLHIEMNNAGAFSTISIESRLVNPEVEKLKLIAEVFAAVTKEPVKLGQRRSKAVPLTVLWLTQLGYNVPTQGSLYIKEQARAIKSFQKLWKIKLIPDGVVDIKTLKKLAERVQAKQ